MKIKIENSPPYRGIHIWIGENISIRLDKRKWCIIRDRAGESEGIHVYRKKQT